MPCRCRCCKTLPDLAPLPLYSVPRISLLASPIPLAHRPSEKESEKQLAADRARRRIVDSDDEDNDAGSSASSQPTSTAHKKKRALTASYLGAEVLSFSSSESGSDGESEQISDGGRGGRRKATNWERESDLDRDEEGFIVDEDEDEEGMKVVNEYREKVTVKAQGMMYFLKVSSDAPRRRRCRATLTFSARADLPPIPRPPYRLPSSRLARRRQRLQSRLRRHQRQLEGLDAELDRFGCMEGESRAQREREGKEGDRSGWSESYMLTMSTPHAGPLQESSR